MVNVVLTLGDEHGLERVDAMMIWMIQGAAVPGWGVDRMLMHEGCTTVSHVDVRSRQYRQRHGGGNRTHGHRESDDPIIQHWPGV